MLSIVKSGVGAVELPTKEIVFLFHLTRNETNMALHQMTTGTVPCVGVDSAHLTNVLTCICIPVELVNQST